MAGDTDASPAAIASPLSPGAECRHTESQKKPARVTSARVRPRPQIPRPAPFCAKDRVASGRPQDKVKASLRGEDPSSVVVVRGDDGGGVVELEGVELLGLEVGDAVLLPQLPAHGQDPVAVDGLALLGVDLG